MDFSLMLSLLDPERFKKRQEAEKAYEKRVFEQLLRDGATDWDEMTVKFADRLLLNAKTWNPVSLFKVEPLTGSVGERCRSNNFVWAPGGKFAYCEHILPRGEPLTLFRGRTTGQVFFTDDVIHPTLVEKHQYDPMPETWMSYTPSEIITQRGGVRAATGRVVMGGLGLGWLLNAVCLKPSVTEVVVVEKQKVIVDWLGPAIRKAYPAVAAKCKKWVVSDVYEFMQQDYDAGRHTETKYVLDIWARYGQRDGDGKYRKWKDKLDSRLWGWGFAEK